MQTFPAIYRGKRLVELAEDIDLPQDARVLVVIPQQGRDEKMLHGQFQQAAEATFARMWDNEADEVWGEYL